MSDKVLIARELLERIVNAPSLTDEGEAIDKLRARLAAQSEDSDVINGVPRELLERLADIAEIEGQPEGAQARTLLTAQPQASAEQSAPVENDAFVPGSLADLLFQLGEKGVSVSGGTHGDRWRIRLPQTVAAQSAPDEGQAFREWFLTPDAQEAGSKSGWCGIAMAAWQARAAWQRAQSVGVPEGYALLSKALELLRGVHTGELFGPDGWETVNAFLSENQHFAHPQVAPVMPDVSAMARVLSDRSADACNIDRTDNWAMYGQEYIEDVQAMLAAAPAQPAALDHGDGMCNADDPSKRCICREEFGRRVCAQDQGEVQSDDTARLDFMLQKHRAVVVERHPDDIHYVYVTEGAMGDYAYQSVQYRGTWKPGTDGARKAQRDAIDAALAASTGQEVKP